MKILLYTLVIAVFVAAKSIEITNLRSGQISYPLIGFGAQRLRDQAHRSKTLIGDGKLGTTTSCENVEQLWFSGAIIDNFAPVESQQKWYGRGQRYWVNKQFWGGVGFPIFVFIGGEGSETCTRLTSKMYMFELAQ
eukprot:gene30191-40108_t